MDATRAFESRISLTKVEELQRTSHQQTPFEMKAVQVYYQCKGTPAIVHADVEEIPYEEKSILTSREFLCRHCGERWVEAINSPIILDQGVEDHLDDYFSNIMYCQQKK